MAASLLPNFINGKFVDVRKDIPQIPVISPADASIIAHVPMCTADYVDEAVLAGQKAFVEWRALTIKQRAAIMFKFHHLMESHAQELAELIVKENGKNIVEALADVAKGNETVEWATSLPQMAVGRVLEVSRGITCEELRNPIGVVAAIVPFNFPGTDHHR